MRAELGCFFVTRSGRGPKVFLEEPQGNTATATTTSNSSYYCWVPALLSMSILIESSQQPYEELIPSLCYR